MVEVKQTNKNTIRKNSKTEKGLSVKQTMDMIQKSRNKNKCERKSNNNEAKVRKCFYHSRIPNSKSDSCVYRFSFV